MNLTYTLHEKMWLYSGESSWYFITIPVEYANEIKFLTGANKRGFGSVKVLASIGSTTWSTSIFPDSKSNSYLLPIKKDIRVLNNLQPGKKYEVEISIVEIA